MSEGDLSGLRGKSLVAAIDFKRLPKVLLHEHLDGGLRPETVIDLAREGGYRGLPTECPDELAMWFHRGAQRGDLTEYLEGFVHTTGVMQTPEAMERVAYEFIEDMRDDGVIYAEVRFAPCLHVLGGMSQDLAVAAVIRGLERGERDFGVGWGLIICAMRHMEPTISLEAAELVVRWRERGVVGFDLAGGEAGFPPKKHIEAFHLIQRANMQITVHAGEAFGLKSIWQAIQYCGAHRLGHATRLRDDIEVGEDGAVRLGHLAQYVLDRRIPLEMCLYSNLHTGACDRLEEHPFGMFLRHGFRVTLNTDDRLMSDTSLSKETVLAAELFDLSLVDIQKLNFNAMKSSFAAYEKRLEFIFGCLNDGYAKLSGGGG